MFKTKLESRARIVILEVAQRASLLAVKLNINY